MKCLHCGEPIRWTETSGWVHGELGDLRHLVPCQPPFFVTLATARPEDL